MTYMPSGTKKRRNPRQRTSTSRYQADIKSKTDKKSPDEKTPEKPKGPIVYPMNYARPLSRLYAFTIDLGFLMMIIYMVAPKASGAIFSNESVAPNLVFLLGYFIVPTTLWGRTPGKWVAGIVVVDSDGRTPGPAAIPREMIGKLVSYLAAGVGILWLVFDPKRQGWHDKIAGTYVVENPYSSGPQFMKDFFKTGKKKKSDAEEPESSDAENEESAESDSK
ncbi:MAG TPA: RDD family protein [Dehalococcoidia bacterium]|nr:RDD family protein [Dehalococcoidia bacterium]